jgi:hypothetical protein
MRSKGNPQTQRAQNAKRNEEGTAQPRKFCVKSSASVKPVTQGILISSQNCTANEILTVCRPKSMEAFMRGITVTLVVIAIIAISGLTLRHMSSAAARHEQAPTVVSKPLPAQNTPDSLLGGPPYP